MPRGFQGLCFSFKDSISAEQSLLWRAGVSPRGSPGGDSLSSEKDQQSTKLKVYFSKYLLRPTFVVLFWNLKKLISIFFSFLHFFIQPLSPAPPTMFQPAHSQTPSPSSQHHILRVGHFCQHHVRNSSWRASRIHRAWRLGYQADIPDYGDTQGGPH